MCKLKNVPQLIPSNLETFLKLEQNKAKLFYFLVESIGSVATEGKQLRTVLKNNREITK